MSRYRHKTSFWVVSATLLILAGAVRAQDGNFYLKDGDRVVFYGDSITEQRQYTTFVEDYVVTRFPRLNVHFVHSGWGGDRVGGGGGGPIDVRLQRDVIAYKPTVMTIMLGMNDASYRAFDQGIFDTYSKGYQHIIDVAKKALPGIRITVIQPSPYDDVTQPPKFEGGYNAVLVRYGQFIQELAKQENLHVADLNTSVVAGLQKAKEIDAALAQKIIPDRVHPGPAGHLLMAEALLKAWNAPALVTAVEIDAAGQRVVRADNTQVGDLKTGDVKAGGTISWTQTDGALPMPADWNDPVVALAVKSSDVVEALNQQPLKVMGLAAGRYTLKIDGMDAGNFSAEQLAQGINLALLPTPMAQQAQQVRKLTRQHNDQHYTRWRAIQEPLTRPERSAAVREAVTPLLAALDAEEEETVVKQRAAAQPVPHRYEISTALPPPAGTNLALKKTYAS
ncbi:MAG: SGNH/GDSL hydrolase family protein, partial [Armatimonadota bacterium]|nr:SGNH/GDSL hydrolase family protein [Armatimonadota bacterium]